MGWTIIEQLKIKYQTLFINFYENYIQAMLVFLFDWNACTKSKTLPLRTRNDSILILIMKVWSPAWLMLKQLPPEAVQRSCLQKLYSALVETVWWCFLRFRDMGEVDGGSIRKNEAAVIGREKKGVAVPHSVFKCFKWSSCKVFRYVIN